MDVALDPRNCALRAFQSTDSRERSKRMYSRRHCRIYILGYCYVARVAFSDFSVGGLHRTSAMEIPGGANGSDFPDEIFGKIR